MFDEIKQSGGYLEPKAAIALIVSKSVTPSLSKLEMSGAYMLPFSFVLISIAHSIVFASAGAYSNRRPAR